MAPTTPGPATPGPSGSVTTPGPVRITVARAMALGLAATTPGPVATTPGPVATTPGPVATIPGPAVTIPGPVVTTPGLVATTPGLPTPQQNFVFSAPALGPATTTGLVITPAVVTPAEVGTEDIDPSQGSTSSTSTLDDTFVWPSDTDLIFAPGSRKVMLMNQRPLVRLVIQDAMELLRADLLFNYAFPVPLVSVEIIRMSLRTSAAQYLGAMDIRRRLLFDEEYSDLMIPLVSFLNVGFTMLNRLYSSVHAFRCSGVRSKNDAAQSSQMICQPLALPTKSNHMLTSNSQCTIIPSQRHMVVLV